LRFRLISLLALIAALAVSGVAVASSSSASSSKTTVPTKITVTLKDYSFTFSRHSVKKGTTVLFTVKNAGTVQHNVDFTSYNKRSPIISPGAKTTLKITFSKKGTIQVVCDVPRHIQLGMVTTFKVI
jgi:plastocyanin